RFRIVDCCETEVDFVSALDSGFIDDRSSDRTGKHAGQRLHRCARIAYAAWPNGSLGFGVRLGFLELWSAFPNDKRVTWDILRLAMDGQLEPLREQLLQARLCLFVSQLDVLLRRSGYVVMF